MLDNTTKRRIDTARDILVGKIPDPKSQVEQITIALVYKFMDDMDAEAEELGGDRKFFADGFSQYGWAKLIRSGLGGHEILNLYAEAITRMSENPGIPLLFRNIFKNAYLPYRDPETLRAFLKIIDEFTYDHSERLGDAFEYLLSVLGSQGDAGQFRTPRHIIDFIVSIVDPGKDEVILDPACGTAGFLISAYKHIKSKNVDNKGNLILTPDDKGKMVKNFKGYDISPDMIRLSLVNMYLHGFSDPHIHEYDTLTSQDRWNEYADVILANPPFMSPKGGIRPHNRFSVQSKRSEVLFVDYIADHLTPEGRAGVIVPEGIIFQSQNAYKQLRKKLVDESLLAVISMPAGIFQPYSGVKTSILILDRELAKKADTVAFYKVENDGYSLGAQRNSINKNDLPEVLSEVEKYKDYIREGDRSVEYLTEKGLVVRRNKIAENGDYNLGGERYRESVKKLTAHIYARLDSIAEIAAGNSAPQEDRYFKNGLYPFVRTADVGKVHRTNSLIDTNDYINEAAVTEHRLRYFPKGTILFPKSGASTFLNHRAILGLDAYVSSHLACIICDATKVLPSYLYALLCQVDARDITPDQAYPSLRLSEIGAIEIPLPPLEAQKEIVDEIEGYQKVIDGARAVVENYKPHIPIDPEWPEIPLKELLSTRAGTTPSRSVPEFFINGNIPWVKTLDLNDGAIHHTEEKITGLALEQTNLNILPIGTVLVAMYGGFNQIGRTGVLEIEATHNQAMTALLPSENVDPYYLNAVLTSSKDHWRQVANSTRKDPNITKNDVINFKIPLPSIEIQKSIVAELVVEQDLVEANRKLIDRFKKKIEAIINRVWDEK